MSVLERIDFSLNTFFFTQNIYVYALQNNQISLNSFKIVLSYLSQGLNFYNQLLGLLIFKLFNSYDRKIICSLLINDKDTLSNFDSHRNLISSLNIGFPKEVDDFSKDFNSELLKIFNVSLTQFIATLAYLEYYHQQILKLYDNYLKQNNIVYIFKYDNEPYQELFQLLEKFPEDEVMKALEFAKQKVNVLLDNYYTSYYFKFCFEKFRAESSIN